MNLAKAAEPVVLTDIASVSTCAMPEVISIQMANLDSQSFQLLNCGAMLRKYHGTETLGISSRVS